MQRSSCVPLPGDGIHQPPAHSPSPDLGTAVPRLGLCPGNAAGQPAEPGGGRQGRTRRGREAEPGTELRPEVLWISPRGASAPARDTVGDFEVCCIGAPSVPLWADL